MNKQKTLALIPITLIAALLVYTSSIILFTNINASWMHYVGLLLFLALPYPQFKNIKIGLFATGIYLILGTINLLSLTPSIITSTFGLRVGSIALWIPSFQPLPFGLLVFYFIVNFNAFVTIYVDYKIKDEPKDQ
jgi:hypothetical protein